MKRLFVYLMASLCSTFAFADGADFVVNGVTIPSGGNSTMEVVINKTNITAFQFDLKLPQGVSVSDDGFSMASKPNTRQFVKAQVNTTTNTWRFLSYDNGNEPFAAGTKFNITLVDKGNATTGEAETDAVLLVDPNGNGQDVDNSTATITAGTFAKITIPESGKKTFVCAKDLDFSNEEGLKAYIATGFDLDNAKLWLTRVTDVPAETPILIKGDPGDYEIPVGISQTYYPKSYFKGHATTTYPIDKSGTYTNMFLDGSSYSIMPDAVDAFPAGLCYIEVPVSINSVVGESVALPMGSYGKKSYVSKSDLDFTDVEDVKAYIVTGYNKAGKIWLTRVNKVSAGTPLFLRGTADICNAPAAGTRSSYVNMLKGDASNSIALPKTEGEFTNCALIDGDWQPLSNDVPSFPAGLSYLPIPTSYLTAASTRGMSDNINVMEEVVAETISIDLSGVIGNKTGIRSIDELRSADVWYNLSGQRIDTPSKKGLYIHNGKKVVVK